MHPFAYARLGYETGLMLMQAQMVIALRMMGLSGMTKQAPGENMRMITEKLAAAQAAGAAAWLAGMQGRDAAEVARAALRPVGRKTRANLRRLTRP